MRYLILTLYGAGVVGAMVSNYLAVTAFLWPVYGASAVAVGVVFDAAWLGASCSWIVLGSRDRMTRAMLIGGVVAATAIQFWQGWTEAGDLGRAVITGGDGQNYYMAALAVLRHAIMPVLGLLCVHALGRDWPKLAGADGEAAGDGASTTTPTATTPTTIDRVTAIVGAQTAILDELADAVADLSAMVAPALAAMDAHPSPRDRGRANGRPPASTSGDPRVAAAIAAGVAPSTARRWRREGDARLEGYAPAARVNGLQPTT